MTKRSKRQPLAPKGGDDVVMTPPLLAKAIIDHYRPTGLLLDPCCGEGAFFNQFGTEAEGVVIKEWCELSEGRDFLTWEGLTASSHFDWCMSNPPWSRVRDFNYRAMGVADNIVWLCLVNALFMTARLRDMDDMGFGIKEICRVPQPHKKEWPQCGFQLGACHIQKGYTGPITLSRLVLPAAPQVEEASPPL